MRNFTQLIEKQWEQNKYLCIGLDPDLAFGKNCFPNNPNKETLFFLTRSIINQTKDIAAAYKPNFAFYIGYGASGLLALGLTVEYILRVAPTVPIILDANIGDIGKTNEGYVRLIDTIDADAITVHPYLGRISLEPILQRKDKGVFVLCRTSNPGADEFQKNIKDPASFKELFERELFEVVAQAVAQEWNSHGNCGLVIGATQPQDLGLIRTNHANIPILIPGVGSQGGSLAKSVTQAKHNFLISVSSELLTNGLDHVATLAQQYHDDINLHR